MKQNLQFILSQQLAITPQLQQAIRMLQLSTVELQQELQLALDNNPLLEQDDPLDEIRTDDSDHASEMDTREAMEQGNVAEDSPLDADWDTLYTAGTPSGTGNDYLSDELPVYQGQTHQSLQDYLNWQAELTPFTHTDHLIATSLIEAIDAKGYLTVTLQDILDSIDDEKLTEEDVQIVLKRLQHFDPVGVGARDLQECLLVQLNQLAIDNPALKAARTIIEHHFDLLAGHDFRNLMRVTRYREETIKLAIQLIQSLDPRPGESFNPTSTDYVIPDILVSKSSHQWIAKLNDDSLPRLHINQHYARLDDDNADQTARQFIRSHLQEARWLIKSVENRNETLLKVARCIVEFQQAFFDKGDEYMRPMVLADIAQQVDMHESTISRITTQKYLYSPKGIFELKYFFSSHVNTDCGGEASSVAIRALIKKLIASENGNKPLSDNQLANCLADQGILVARRTVTKYRESLAIPSSSHRKKLL